MTVVAIAGSAGLFDRSICMILAPRYPVTPDGRYFVVDGRLWRTTDPTLDEARRHDLVVDLMAARRAVAVARKAQDRGAERLARDAVNVAKEGLGERGPVWWADGAPDLNRHLARNTPYAQWYADLPPASRRSVQTRRARVTAGGIAPEGSPAGMKPFQHDASQVL